jgi:hypothetical protein
VALFVLVAVLSAGGGALLISRVDDPDASPSATTSARAVRRVGRLGASETVGPWQVVLQRWDETPRDGSARLVVRLRISNTSDLQRTSFAPDQVALRYQIPPAAGQGGGYYVRSPDDGTSAVDVDRRSSFDADYLWELPDGVRNVVLWIQGPRHDDIATEILFNRPPDVASPDAGGCVPPMEAVRQ